MLIWARLLHSVDRMERASLVSVIRVFGSTPREAGTRMVVTADDTIGTIGGGCLEWQAIQTARRRLGEVAGGPLLQTRILGPDLGQCCGGRIEIATEIFDAADRPLLAGMAACEAAGPFTLTGRIVAPDFVEHFGERRSKLYLFGAGHVGRAVITALSPLIDAARGAAALPLEVVWADSRAGSFAGLTLPPAVTARCCEDPVSLMADAQPGSFVLIMTHSHDLDYELTAAALRQPDMAFVGLIGSGTKRARFLHRLREAHIDPARIDSLICPIGLTAIRSKHPAAIATGVVAQLLLRAEQMRTAATRGDAVVQFKQQVGERSR